MQEVKILRLPMEFKKAENEMNGYLSDGFEIFAIHPVRESLVYTLLKTTKIYGAGGATGFPSDRQMGYLAWAYREALVDTDNLTISRKDASALIEAHKDISPGEPFSSEELATTHLKIVLGDLFVGDKKPVEDDDDIPF